MGGFGINKKSWRRVFSQERERGLFSGKIRERRKVFAPYFSGKKTSQSLKYRKQFFKKNGESYFFEKDEPPRDFSEKKNR